MIALVPYHADVVMDRMPIANWVVMGVTILVSLWGFQAPSHIRDERLVIKYGDVPPEVREDEEFLREIMRGPKQPPTLFDRMVLSGWSLSGIFGHMFLHAGWVHLVANMLFLFVFGNAVCAKVGNFWYPFVYLAAGLVAAVIHLLFSDELAVGASGAINGTVGIFLMYYPNNDVRWWWWLFVRFGTFAVSSIFLILFFFVYDLLGVFMLGGEVAYAAHIGGFLFGVSLGALLLGLGICPTTRYERSLFDVMQGRMT